VKPVISTTFVVVFSVACYLFTIVLVAGTAVSIVYYGSATALFFMSLPALIALGFLFYLYYQIRILLAIPDILNPDERIRVIKNYLRRNTLNTNLPIYGKLRKNFFLLIAFAYVEKGEYLLAYEACAMVRRFLPPYFSKKSSLTGGEAGIYAAEIETLIHLGRFKPAKTLLNGLLAKSYSDTAGLFMSKYSQLYYMIYNNDCDIDAAREKLNKLWAFVSDSAVHKQFPTCDFKYTLLFLEAKLDMQEKKYSEARAKFENITHDSRHYGNVRLAREELNYWTTRF
jgi:hypothetical protein